MNVERDFASYVEAELQHVPPLRPGALQEALEQVAVDSQHRPRDLGAQSPKWRFQSMFSATMFIVAGVIVALFGGFLLSGVLTQPSDEQVPAVGATASAGASLPPEPGLDVRELEWRPLDLDEAAFGPGARLADIAASDSRLAIGGSVDGDAAVWTSTDGLEWERVPHDDGVFGGPADLGIKAIVPWQDGFVAAGEVDPGSDFDPRRVAAVWISMDGKDWARVPHDEQVFGGRGRQEMFDIAASDDRLVIVGFDEEGPCCTDARADHDIAVWTSDDGSEWSRQTFGGGEMLALAGTTEGFVGVGHRGMWTSPDCLQWEREDPGDLRHATLLGVAPTPSGFVAVGLDSPPGELAGAWTSSDGTDWTPAEITAPSSVGEWWMPHGVALAGSGLAQVVGPNRYGDGRSAILVSEDGRSWVPGDTSAPVSDAHLRKISAFGDHFVAIGSARGPREPGQAGIWTTLEPSELSPETDGPAEPVERDTTTTSDLLPGVDLVTEEVEPGVYRVISDGVRDLERELDWRDSDVLQIVPGLDGSVLLTTGEKFFRLGSPEVFVDRDPRIVEFMGETQVSRFLPFGVAPTGTLWGRAGAPDDLATWDGERWVVIEEPGYMNLVPDEWGDDPYPGDSIRALLGAGGSVWVVAKPGVPGPGSLFRVNDDGFEPLGVVDWITADATGELILVAHDDGIRLVTSTGLEQYSESHGLDGSEPAGVTSDGTLWWATPSVGGCPVGLARLEAEGWSTFDIPDGAVNREERGARGCGVTVAPDGSVWVGHGAFDMPGAGVHRFDGSTWTQYLPDLTVHDLESAPDGSVWLWARTHFPGQEPDSPEVPGGLYVITPEAMAATEQWSPSADRVTSVRDLSES